MVSVMLEFVTRTAYAMHGGAHILVCVAECMVIIWKRMTIDIVARGDFYHIDGSICGGRRRVGSYDSCS